MIPPIARRFVAGESVATALDRVRRVNDRGIGGIVNYLGEHYTERAPAAADADVYHQLVGDIAGTDLRACLSIKPSQLGLGVSETCFRELLDPLVEYAAESGVFIWLDMEDHTTTDATLDAYEELASKHGGGIGVCMQANLHRTPADIQRLADVPGKVRLVKGAYDEPQSIAHQEKRAVDNAYRECLATMFAEFDGGIAVGSHDPDMLDYAERLHEEHGTPYEVQMLMGVREDAQEELARDHEVWQYIPYGSRWFAYFTRRVAERKENALFALRAVLGR